MHLLKYKAKGQECFLCPSSVFLNAYLTTTRWLLKIKTDPPYPPSPRYRGFRWSPRGADASLAAMTSKVYFAVHLRLQDCNTCMGIRAVMAASREQWRRLWWSEGRCGCRLRFTTLCKTAADISVPVSCVVEVRVRGIQPGSPGPGLKTGRILSFSAVINH